MKRSAICLAVLVLAAGAANAARPTADTALTGRDDVAWPRDVFWFDDVESGTNGWTHGDWTATGAPPKFHIDSYMAYGGSGNSWWCGSFDYDADGGYGNNWFEFLSIPATDVSSTGVPESGRSPVSENAVWTFCFRYDCEPTYDFAYIQAEDLGAYVNLESFDGYGAWQDLGDYGYMIDAYDNPFKGRFLFTSDGSWSDADGNNTVGGGFACDNIRLFHPYSGTVFFYDDGESGGLCTPGQAVPAGDYWHIAYDLCSSYSKPHSWQCVDEADTTKLPPYMQNWLGSPWIDIDEQRTVKWHARGHFEIAGYDGDYWYVWATFDGLNYYTLKANYGDYGRCDGWSTSYWNGVELSTIAGITLPQPAVQFVIAMFTDANGTLPTVGGCCGIVFDDILVDTGSLPVESRSWGSVKAMYR